VNDVIEVRADGLEHDLEGVNNLHRLRFDIRARQLNRGRIDAGDRANLYKLSDFRDVTLWPDRRHRVGRCRRFYFR
jgi:hypothetical protein